MKRYKVIKNGKVTNSWTSADFGADHYEHCFGKPERWVRADQEDISGALETRESVDIDGTTIVEYRLPAEFTIVEEDITQEINAQKQEEALAKAAEARLKALDVLQSLQGATTVAALRVAVASILADLVIVNKRKL